MSRLGDVLVLGLGRSGEAAARYCLQRLGGDVDSVTVIDGSSSPKVIELADELVSLGASVAVGVTVVSGSYDLCIASPGIPPHSPMMLAARRACGEIVSEIEFAYSRSSNPWVAVTGTNGKTTTTSLVTHLLTSAGVPARSVGNIGVPAIAAVEDAERDEILVAEVSSFQLAFTKTFRPRVAVLLNVTPDHIDWHGSYDAYAADKGKVFDNLGADDLAVVDVDDPGSAAFADVLAERGVPLTRVSTADAQTRGAHMRDGLLVLETAAGTVELVRADELLIKGRHNVGNALAAAAAVHALGVSEADLREGLRDFAPIEHRLEPVATVSGVEWFNDSKATNPDAVFKAINAFTDRPYVLLLGGRNKGNDFVPLALEAARGARAVITFGEAGPEIAAAFDGASLAPVSVARLSDAVAEAARLARDGDAVVLSPACASFDEFDSYEHRGREFKAMVRALEAGVSE